MATTTITWKNNSTDQSPTATKIERYEDFPKGHEHATAPVEIANGNTGGLDPTIANGTYDDTTASGGKYYSYSVSTIKGDEVSEGVPTASEWVADQDNDLGYVGGLPEIGKTYNCSVAPFLHIDIDRLKNYKSTLATQSGENGYRQVLDNGAEGFLRADNNGSFTYKTEGATNQPQYNSDLFTDGDGLSTVGQTQHRVNGFRVQTSENIFYPDGFTLFRAVGGTFGTGNMMGVGTHVHRAPAGPDGEAYNQGSWSSSSVGFWGTSINITLTGGKSAPGMGSWGTLGESSFITRGHTATFYILAFRFSNTAEAYASGNLQGQVFSAGNLILTTPNLASKSYHNPTGAEKYGAFHAHTTLPIDLLNNGTYPIIAGEHLFFGSALDANDMNQVFGYLCTKYGFEQNILSESDLVN